MTMKAVIKARCVGCGEKCGKKRTYEIYGKENILKEVAKMIQNESLDKLKIEWFWDGGPD